MFVLKKKAWNILLGAGYLMSLVGLAVYIY